MHFVIPIAFTISHLQTHHRAHAWAPGPHRL